ncbi:MAG: exodeoxyribonuclease VII small subunit [Ferruginibacter sp.]
MNENLTYETAFSELSQIANDIESETIAVDELSGKVKRAAVLITFCQTRLTSTEEEVKKVLSQMERKNNARD